MAVKARGGRRTSRCRGRRRGPCCGEHRAEDVHHDLHRANGLVDDGGHLAHFLPEAGVGLLGDRLDSDERCLHLVAQADELSKLR